MHANHRRICAMNIGLLIWSGFIVQLSGVSLTSDRPHLFLYFSGLLVTLLMFLIFIIRPRNHTNLPKKRFSSTVHLLTPVITGALAFPAFSASIFMETSPVTPSPAIIDFFLIFGLAYAFGSPD